MPRPTTPRPGGDAGFPRWLKWGLLGALAVLVVGYGIIFLYAKVLNDSPDELDQGDLAAALADDPTAPTGATAATLEPPPTASGSVWNVTDASEARVPGRGGAVRCQYARCRSNRPDHRLADDRGQHGHCRRVHGRRRQYHQRREPYDGQFRGRIMSTDEFPTAVFRLTEPIELGLEPAEGAQVSTSATGELTLRGVTNPVTFELTAQLVNGKIGVLGEHPGGVRRLQHRQPVDRRHHHRGQRPTRVRVGLRPV